MAVLNFGQLLKIDAIILKCNFKTVNVNDWGPFYSCEAENFRSSLADRHITEIQGIHSKGKSNDDVTRLFMEKMFCPYLPSNLAAYFPNLKILYVKNCNVQHLVDGDLDGLTKLRTFDISYNPIEHLGPNFFKGHESIETISFYDCHLKFVDRQALTPLVNLEGAYFDLNICTEFRCEYASCINAVKVEVPDKCQINNTVSCSSDDGPSQPEDLPFVRRNANVLISLNGIILIALVIALVKVGRKEFGGNWSEMRTFLL